MKPIFNRRYGEWNEDELAMAMTILEREYHNQKKRGPLPCDLLSAKNVEVLDVSKSKSTDHTTSTETSATSDQYTRTGKFSIYDLERQSEALKKNNYTPEAKVQAFADWVKEQEDV